MTFIRNKSALGHSIVKLMTIFYEYLKTHMVFRSSRILNTAAIVCLMVNLLSYKKSYFGVVRSLNITMHSYQFYKNTLLRAEENWEY